MYHGGISPELCDDEDLLVLDRRGEGREFAVGVGEEASGELAVVFEDREEVVGEEAQEDV